MKQKRILKKIYRKWDTLLSNMQLVLYTNATTKQLNHMTMHTYLFIYPYLKMETFHILFLFFKFIFILIFCPCISGEFWVRNLWFFKFGSLINSIEMMTICVKCTRFSTKISNSNIKLLLFHG